MSVHKHLPGHAQTIYREAFNSAGDQYINSKKREVGGIREAVSHRVAWSAVETKYIKGNWVEKT